MSLFIPISKVDVAQRLVYGVLTAEVADKSGEILDYASAKPAFEKWSNDIFDATGGKSKGNVRAMHGSVAAGKFTDISYDDDAKRIDGCAKIVDDAEWNKVLEGVYTGFSIGGGYAKRWTDPTDSKLKRYTPVLSEVSIVDNPCVASATFELIKSDGSHEMRKFTHSHKEDSMTKATEGSAAAAVDEAAEASAKIDLSAEAGKEGALEKAAVDSDVTDAAAGEVAKADAAGVDAVKDGKAVKPATGPVQKWEASDGRTFLSKREAEVHNLEIEKAAEHAPAMAKMEALLKGEDEVTEVKPGEEKPADAAKAADSEVKKADDSKTTDEVKKAAEATPLQKGLYDIGWFACILSDINAFTGNAQWEAMFEGDGSTLPGQLKSWLKQGAMLLTAYVTEEASELAGDDGDVLAMAAKMDSSHASALAKHLKDGALKGELEKAGARHSKTDKEGLMALHKSATDHVDAIEKCFKGMGVMEDAAAKSAESKELQKVSKLLEETLSHERAEKTALTTVIGKMNSTLEKAMDSIGELKVEKSELVKRVAHLEEQPMPAKGHVKAMSKAQDNGGTGDGNPSPEKVTADLSKLSPDQRSLVLMKAALANPLSL